MSLGKHLTKNKRIKLEGMLQLSASNKANKVVSIRNIAKMLGVHYSTVYREIKRGQYIHRNSDWTEEERYSCDLAENKYRDMLRKKGRKKKLEGEEAAEFIRYIENEILVKKNSPYVALQNAKKHGVPLSDEISLSTVYNGIKSGLSLIWR